MRAIEVLAAITTSDLTGLYPKIMTAVETEMREARFGAQLVKENRDLTGKGRTLTVPYRSRIAYSGTTAVGYVAEGTSPTEVKATYTTVEVTVTKIGASFKVTQEAIDSVAVDIIKDQIAEVGEALADFEDWMIMDELYGASEVTTIISGDTTMTLSGPILDILEYRETDASGTDKMSEITYIDAYLNSANGQVFVSATYTNVYFKYKKSSRTNWFEGVGTVTVADYIDLVKGRTEMKKLKYHPNICVFGPDHEAKLLEDSRFIDASQYGAREPVLNGEIGKAAGLKLLTAIHTYGRALLFLDTDKAAWLILKRELDMKLKELPEEDSFAYYFYRECIPAVIHEDAIVLVAVDYTV